jgi:hypothetical protein
VLDVLDVPALLVEAAPLDVEPLPLVAESVAELVDVVELTVDPGVAWATWASWTTSAATPPAPITTMPAVTWVSRRAPRARTLAGRCCDVMTLFCHA